MQFHAQPPRLSDRRSVGSRAQSFIVKMLAGAAVGVTLFSAVAISIALFAVALTGLFLVAAYLWWKTRALRKQVRSRAYSRFEEGDVLDGVVIREIDGRQVGKRRPGDR